MIRTGLRLGGLLVLAWSVMVVTHEAGHLIGGWLGGARLRQLDLAPWRLPYSLHAPDPHPRVTLWAGPLFGVAAPLALAFACRGPWCWFVADFCLLANGTYLLLGWIAGDRLLDAPRLLAEGAAAWHILLYSALTIGIGYPRFRADVERLISPRHSPRSRR